MDEYVQGNNGSKHFIIPAIHENKDMLKEYEKILNKIKYPN